MKFLPVNASKDQIEFYNLVCMMKPNHKIYCEYNVAKLLEIYWKAEKVETENQDRNLYKTCKKLHFDFYDQTCNIVFEIQGLQHDKFIEYFHQDLGGFDRQARNDRLKRQVCVVTNTKLIEIRNKPSYQSIIKMYRGV